MFPSTVLVALGWQMTAGAPVPPTAAPPATTVIPFRTEAQPRVDPVFGDASALRATVDRFFALEAEMARTRDEFGAAVHETLGTLAGAVSPKAAARRLPTSVSASLAAAGAARACPAASAAPYGRALNAGTRYLALGQLLRGRYRDIRRADDLGDTIALTPDYRLKARKTKDLFQQLLTDYREMRVAFYDQLGAEMRHAGCKPGPQAPTDAAPGPDPADPAAWSLDEPMTDAVMDTPAPAPVTSVEAPKPGPAPVAGPVATPEAGGVVIWIEIDNTPCGQPTRVSIDGQPVGEIAPRRKMPVRTRPGPREICALPASDARACGDSGTIRKAYLHEGWTLSVHCAQ